MACMCMDGQLWQRLSFGWSKRRPAEGYSQQPDSKNWDNGMKEGLAEKSINGNKSFAEVLKGDKAMKEDQNRNRIVQKRTEQGSMKDFVNVLE